MNETNHQTEHGASVLPTLEKVRDTIADTMHATAHTIQQQLKSDRPDPGASVQWGLRTSEWLDRLSEELRHVDVRSHESRLRDSISRHPGGALLVAGAAGILLGRILRRRGA